MALRRIFGPKRDGIRGGWSNLYNEELHNLKSLPNIFKIMKSRIMRWTGRVARILKEDNIKMCLREIG
jgi:hypothetical protein